MLLYLKMDSIALLNASGHLTINIFPAYAAATFLFHVALI